MSAIASYALIACLCTFASCAHAQAVEWTDAHFHFIAEDEAAAERLAAEALEIMAKEGLRSVVVMPPPQPKPGALDGMGLVRALQKHGGRFAVLGGGASLNPMLQNMAGAPNLAEARQGDFRELALRIAASGVRGFGEIALHHVSLNPMHPYESVPGDHVLMRLLADIAAEKDLVIDVHFDPVLKRTPVPEALKGFNNPAVLEPNVEAFERLLAHNRKARIVWAHAGGFDEVGDFTPVLVRELLGRHENLSLSLRPLAPTAGAMLSPSGKLNPDWVALVQAFPERFVLGSDSFLVSGTMGARGAARMFAQRSQRQRQGVRSVLDALPPDVAKKVGTENAARIYRLN